MSCSRCSSWVRALGLGLLLSTVSVHGAPGDSLGAWCCVTRAARRTPPKERIARGFATLLKQRADVNAPQVDGMTALHWAAYHDDLETAELLVQAGANVKAANRYGVTPLSLACTNGNGAIVELLLKAGADPNAPLPGGETPLMTAARTGALAAVKALLSHGASVDAKDDGAGRRRLMWAAAEGHAAVVQALIEAGADFRARLPSGFTPLLFAVARRAHRRRPRAAEGRRGRQRDDTGRGTRTRLRRPAAAGGRQRRCCWRSRTRTSSWRRSCWTPAPIRTPICPATRSSTRSRRSASRASATTIPPPKGPAR